MHRRHGNKNIPIELLRALVTVVDGGSFTGAAEKLNLTQPAISAQIARLSRLLGGSIFAKGKGVTPTTRGLQTIRYARRILDMNDQLFAQAGPNSAPRQLVVGLASWMEHNQLIAIFERCSASPTGEHVSFRCDRVEQLIGDLNAGNIDAAYVCNVKEPPGVVVAEWSEPMYWVKSPKLTLAPAAPIPLVSWPGSKPDQVAVSLLQESGMHFFFSCTAPDLSARRAAVVAGLGVMPLTTRVITPEMEVIHDYLPSLPEIKSGIFARSGLDLRRLAAFLRMLTEALEPPSLPLRAPAILKALQQRPAARKRRDTRHRV